MDCLFPYAGERSSSSYPFLESCRIHSLHAPEAKIVAQRFLRWCREFLEGRGVKWCGYRVVATDGCFKRQRKALDGFLQPILKITAHFGNGGAFFILHGFAEDRRGSNALPTHLLLLLQEIKRRSVYAHVEARWIFIRRKAVEGALVLFLDDPVVGHFFRSFLPASRQNRHRLLSIVDGARALRQERR